MRLSQWFSDASQLKEFTFLGPSDPRALGSGPMFFPSALVGGQVMRAELEGGGVSQGPSCLLF